MTPTDMSHKVPPVYQVPIEGEQAQRLAYLSETFISAFSQEPQFFTRAPGRQVFCTKILMHLFQLDQSAT